MLYIWLSFIKFWLFCIFFIFNGNTPFIFFVALFFLHDFYLIFMYSFCFRIRVILLLKLFAVYISAIRIWLHWIPWEEICESVVTKEGTNFAKFEQIFQNVLTQKPCYDAHSRWKTSRADAFSFDLALIAVISDHKRRCTGKACRLTRYQKLNMTAHCSLTNAWLEPDLV